MNHTRRDNIKLDKIKCLVIDEADMMLDMGGKVHGELEQQERLRTIEKFRRGEFRYLIAADVAARGR